MASKYRAVPTTVGGIRFASQAEARRYAELRLMARAGVITQLECHPRYRITVNGQAICTYEADFRYVDSGSGAVIVEDVKGVRTAVYRIKRRLMLACHGSIVREVEA